MKSARITKSLMKNLKKFGNPVVANNGYMKPPSNRKDMLCEKKLEG